MTLTIRQRLEAIRDGAAQHPYRYEPPLDFLIEIENHAAAALEILKNAEIQHRGATQADVCRLVPDPAPPTENP